MPLRFTTKKILGHTIHLAIAGAGPPLILIHGINIGWGQWYPNITDLAAHYTLYLIDLPGAGSSSSLQYATSHLERDFVEPIEGLIEELGLRNVRMIGHSFGAWIVSSIAARGRIDLEAIILISPLGFSSYVPPSFYPITLYPTAWLLSNVVLRPTIKNLQSVIGKMLNPNAVLPNEFWEYYQAVITSHAHPFLFIHRLCSPFRMKHELGLGRELEKIGARVLLILGENDPLLEGSRVASEAQKVQRLVAKTYPHTGHVPALEQPVQFNQDALEFLSSI